MLFTWRTSTEPYFVKYTNPARGILDFCQQKFYRPLLCSQWALYSMYTQCYEATTLHTTPGHCETHPGHWALRNTPVLTCMKSEILAPTTKTRNLYKLKKAPPPYERGLISSWSTASARESAKAPWLLIHRQIPPFGGRILFSKLGDNSADGRIDGRIKSALSPCFAKLRGR